VIYKIKECRKPIVKDNKDLNKKYEKIPYPFYERWYRKAKENKKKIIFFIVVVGLTMWYEGYKSSLFFLKIDN
jgi:hypothetical protein